MAGTVVVTSAQIGNHERAWQRFSVAWTSTAGGDVSGNGFSVPAGELISARFIPGTGGTAPTAAYDVTLTDGSVPDLLQSAAGANLSATVPTLSVWNPPVFQDGSRTLDVVVANAGDSKTETVVLIIRT
jgi:hypothetical protein